MKYKRQKKALGTSLLNCSVFARSKIGVRSARFFMSRIELADDDDETDYRGE